MPLTADDRRVWFQRHARPGFKDWETYAADLERRIEDLVARIRVRTATVVESVASSASEAGLAQYHGLHYGPIGLWQFDRSMSDTSGSGNDFSISTGTERYAPLLPNVRGFFFDGSTILIAASDPAFQITGDMTGECLAVFPRQVDADASNNPSLMACGTFSTPGEAANQLYDVNITSNSHVTFFHENGSSLGNVATLSDTVVEIGAPVHFAWVRTVADKTYRVYVNGEVLGSGTYTNDPTGGTSSPLRMASSGGADPILHDSVVASMKLFDKALTADQIKAEYNRTLGPVYGALA